MLDADPIRQFDAWFQRALSEGLKEPTAMTLATASAAGEPSARTVLLKGFDHNGFVFFTNYESQKGRELTENPRAALVFFWAELERQVRISGEVSHTSSEESDAYFRTRGTGSQISAVVSRQSEAIASREVLERAWSELMEEYPNGNIPRPERWGGFRLRATMLEFWQARPNRLHDRIRYRLQADGSWRIERLAP